MKLANLQKELDNLQDNVIGLFKPTLSSTIEMVVSNEDGLLKCIHIGNLGGMHETHIPASKGKLVMFPDNSTLSKMKCNPYKLQEITDSLK